MSAGDQVLIKRLTPHIGAEIGGVDLSQPLEPKQVDAIKQALWEHQVIFFRDQPLSHAQHVRFGQYFGDLFTHPAAKKTETDDGSKKPKAYASTVDGYPQVIRIYADEYSMQVAGEELHADVTSEVTPPFGSILRMEELPEIGGDTLFVSMYAAYDALSESMKRFLAPLTAIHDGSLYGSRSGFDNSREYPRTEHPVICTHPVSGRTCLYVSKAFTKRIVQLSEQESDAVLSFLFGHVKNALFQCRFRWAKNSIAFWDNRCTLHQALWDYFPQRRVGYRVQFQGTRPFQKQAA